MPIGLNKFFTKFNFSKYYGQRIAVSEKLLNYFWPNHSVFFIEEKEFYSGIEMRLFNFTLDKNYKDIIILQTEEDWFYHYDLENLRRTIRQSSAWTKNSFLITNSKKDAELSSRYINSVWKPGLLDLICYMPYSMTKANTLKYSDNIKYHTALFNRNARPAREEVFQILDNHKEKCSVLRWEDKTIVDNINDKSLHEINFMDAPFVYINHDADWVESSAFITSVETFHNFKTKKNLYQYMPTLSEKTFKAMHLLRPALIFGGPGVREYLKALGFDTWDWFIDWSYSYEQDGKKALQLYLKELQRLLNTDVKKLVHLLEKNKDKLYYNRRQIYKLINYYNKGVKWQ